MEAFQTASSPDVVDVLRQEHQQIRQLCIDLQGAGSDRKTQSLTTLRRAVRLHQLGEAVVAHPAAYGSGPNGDSIARLCQSEGEQLERSLAELGRLGVAHPDFDDRFAAWSRAWIEHAAREERDEFPLLRLYVPAQRLHMMAGTMHDVQIMSLT